jgi:hypothetical protein
MADKALKQTDLRNQNKSNESSDESSDDSSDDDDDSDDDAGWPSEETLKQSGYSISDEEIMHALAGGELSVRVPGRFERHNALVREHIAKFLLTCSACGRDGRVSNTAATAAIPAALCLAVADKKNLEDLGTEKLVACLESVGVSRPRAFEGMDDDDRKAALATSLQMFTELAAGSVEHEVDMWLSWSRPLLCCGRCGKANYCDRKCQVAHWEASHKSVCKAASSPAPSAASRSPPASPQGRS